MPPTAGPGAGSSKKVKEGKGKGKGGGKEKGKSRGGSDSADRAAHRGSRGAGEDGRLSTTPGNDSAEDDERQARAACGRGRRRRAPNSAHAQLFDGGLQCSSEEEESVIGEEQLLGGIQVELEPLGKNPTDTVDILR